MRRQSWTPEDDAKVRAMVADCLTYAQMSERTGRTAESIRTRYLRHIRPTSGGPAVLAGRPPRVPWSVEESIQAFELHQQGWSQRAIANKLGRNKSNVQVHIRKYQNPEQVALLAKRQQVNRQARDRLSCVQWVPEPYASLELAEAAVLRERDARRGLEPLTLTARLCGDPLPGRSALERRTQGDR